MLAVQCSAVKALHLATQSRRWSLLVPYSAFSTVLVIGEVSRDGLAFQMHTFRRYQ